MLHQSICLQDQDPKSDMRLHALLISHQTILKNINIFLEVQ